MSQTAKITTDLSPPFVETVVLTMRQAAAARWAVAAFEDMAVTLMARPAQAEAELFAALSTLSDERGWALEIARDLGREVMRHPAALSGQLFHLELRRVAHDAPAPFFGAAVTRYVRLPGGTPLSPRMNVTADDELGVFAKGAALCFAAYPSDIDELDGHRQFLEDKAALNRVDQLQRRMLAEAIAASAQSLEAQTVLVGVLTQLKSLGTQIALLQQEATGTKAAAARAARLDGLALDDALGKASLAAATLSPQPQNLALQTLIQGWREQMHETPLLPVAPVAVIQATPRLLQPAQPSVFARPVSTRTYAASTPTSLPMMPSAPPVTERQPAAQPSGVATAQQPLAPTTAAAIETMPLAPQAQNDNAPLPQTPSAGHEHKAAPRELPQHAVVQPETGKQPDAPLLSPTPPQQQDRAAPPPSPSEAVNVTPQPEQAKQPDIAPPVQEPPVPTPATQQRDATQKPAQGPTDVKNADHRQERQGPQRDVPGDGGDRPAAPEETRAKGAQVRRSEERPDDKWDRRPVGDTSDIGKHADNFVPIAERAKPNQEAMARHTETPTKPAAETARSFHDRVAETVKQTEKVQDAFTKEKEKTCRDTCTSGGDCTRCGAAAAMQRMLANLQP